MLNKTGREEIRAIFSDETPVVVGNNRINVRRKAEKLYGPERVGLRGGASVSVMVWVSGTDKAGIL